MQKQKTLSRDNLGFTLIEILLVIAIIGILAGAVFAMIGNSDNTKIKATMSTAKSILTYAQECQFKGENLIPPVPDTGLGSGDIICNDTITEWPELSVNGCVYKIINATNGEYEVDCNGAGITKKIVCSALKGSCVEQ